MGLPVARVSDSPPRKKRGGGRSNAHAQVTPASPPKPNHIVAPQFASYEGEVGDILLHCALPPRRQKATGIYSSLDLALALDRAEDVATSELSPNLNHRFALTLRRSKTDPADARCWLNIAAPEKQHQKKYQKVCF